MTNHCVSGTKQNPGDTAINMTFKLPQTGFVFIPFITTIQVFNTFWKKKKKEDINIK